MPLDEVEIGILFYNKVLADFILLLRLVANPCCARDVWDNVRGNPCNVFAGPFQGECRLTPPPGSTVRCNPCNVFADPFQGEC